MTLVVAGRIIEGPQRLSEVTRLALAFVEGGTEWIGWASRAPQHHHAFSDESTLLDAVQQGLHGSRYALLPKLRLLVSPVKLMTMGIADLRLLAHAEAGDDSAILAGQLEEVLTRHELVGQTGFTQLRRFLSDLGVADAPIFQALAVEDLVSLHPLVAASAGGPTTGELQTEAARFAVEASRTPAEFTDYHQAYLGYLTRRGALDQGAEQRLWLAASAVETVTPLLYGALDCPKVEGLLPPSGVAAAVEAWQRQGRFVGFARLSGAVANVLRHSGYDGGNAEQARQAIDRYLASLQSFLAANPPGQGRLGQDGASGLFPIEAGGLRCELFRDAGGAISTRLFGRASHDPAVAR